MIKSVQIVPVHLETLTNAVHFSFMKMAKERFGNFLEDEKFLNGGETSRRSRDVVGLKNREKEFVASFEKEDVLFAKSSKNSNTKSLSAADEKQDVLYSSLKKSVSSFKKFPVEDMARAACRVAETFDVYNVDVKEAIASEAGRVSNLLQDLEGKHKDDIALLSLTVYVEQLRKANDEVFALLKARDDENGAKEVGALKKARASCDESYRSCVEYVNALAVIDGDEDYKDFINSFNAMIEKSR